MTTRNDWRLPPGVALRCLRCGEAGCRLLMPAAATKVCEVEQRHDERKSERVKMRCSTAVSDSLLNQYRQAPCRHSIGDDGRHAGGEQPCPRADVPSERTSQTLAGVTQEQEKGPERNAVQRPPQGESNKIGCGWRSHDTQRSGEERKRPGEGQHARHRDVASMGFQPMGKAVGRFFEPDLEWCRRPGRHRPGQRHRRPVLARRALEAVRRPPESIQGPATAVAVRPPGDGPS